jgi:hypothetical protein
VLSAGIERDLADLVRVHSVASDVVEVAVELGCDIRLA